MPISDDVNQPAVAPSDLIDPYLIWSNEHRAWWGPDRRGYTIRLAEAGRYPRTMALAIVAKAIPGTAQRMGMMPELPVREADVLRAVTDFQRDYPGLAVP